ncbi:type VII secretion integral membrane protein EccD [Mycobacterium fragae]|uniref:type VII secretion integral membrane protein EccD n=1 Tax=Mycobacterium fragae TaxID=1260918 RepID=UPI001D0A3600|nr:type VII secretion integral membrane protein EccD [Mycobacterium fragae]
MHQAVEVPATGAELRRVSVCADAVSVDLALPAAVPVASLMPAIVDILATEYRHRGESVPAWHRLSLPGDAPLDMSKTLAQLGIRDGSILVFTGPSTELTAPRFDDVAEAVSMSLAERARPWTRRTARLAGAITASWLAGAGALVLIRAAFDTADARRVSAGVAAAIGCIALLASGVAYRGFRDVIAGLTLGLLASGFASLAGLLAVPGGPGAPNALLAAMAGAAMSALVMGVTGCGTTVFIALSCLAMVAAAAALVGALTAGSPQAIAAASAAISLALLELSARVSILFAGLSPEGDADEPADPHRLKAKALRADSLLSSLVAAFAAAAALGAIGTAVAAHCAGGTRLLGIAFATVVGGVLLLRARAHGDQARSVPLVVSGTATLSVTFVVAAIAGPLQPPWVAGVAATLATAALCLGFIAPALTFSPVLRRGVDLLEYLALAAIVPLVCWICGLYGAARGLSLS